MGDTFKLISVIAHKVPYEPVTILLRSYPVTFLTTVPPDLIFAPDPLTALNPST